MLRVCTTAQALSRTISYPLKHLKRVVHWPVPKPNPPRLRKLEPQVTVCIAAICNNGKNLICASDGALSDTVSQVSGDVMASKMLFLDSWAFLLAGTLSNGDLILEELRLAAIEGNKAKLNRENVRRMLAKAYRKQFSNWLAERWLAQYDMDMGEFKKKGKDYFGEERSSELARSMDQDAVVNFNESVLVAGWGASPLSATIVGMERSSFASHTLNGFAAIGAGAAVAMPTLMQL